MCVCLSSLCVFSFLIGNTPQVLLSDSLTFSRQVNEAVRNCFIPKQIWKAKDLDLYEQTPSLPVRPPKSLLPSLPNAGPSAGVTAKKIHPLKRIDKKKSSEPCPAGGAAAAASKACSTPEPGKAEKDTSSEGRRDGWKAPEHFRKHGWLSEEDFNLLDKEGVVCPVGCNEDGVDRVRVKVWKDEFHVVRTNKKDTHSISFCSCCQASAVSWPRVCSSNGRPSTDYQYLYLTICLSTYAFV